jgi:xanthine dehydrogenase YagR molybdenum-binding subunit
MTVDMTKLFGLPVTRVDGVAKVTGAARYASDEPLANPAYAYLVTSTISRGRLAGLTLDRAKAVRGVLDILTHENVGSQVHPQLGPTGGPTTTTLESDRIWHDGQIIAVVVAETFEAAREAANKVEARYDSEPASASVTSVGVQIEAHKGGDPDPSKGDAEAAFDTAAVKIDVRYSTPTQHHNPMELYTTTCVWEGPRLTVYEPSQSMWGLKAAVAARLGMDIANVRTVARFVGGAFGGKGAATARTAWIAIASRRIGRPVKLVPTRAQGFSIVTFRAETQQRVKLGAATDGRLTSFSHEVWEVTSRPSAFVVAGVDLSTRMYASRTIATTVHVVHADRATPGFMRAPEATYMFGLESAIDELAQALRMDPVELRRVNDTQIDPVTGLPFSSRSLMQCFDQAAARFGWSNRNAEPGMKRDGDWLVGYGCAAASYSANVAPAAARLSLTPDGKATIGLAGHELGTGAYTTVAITVAGSLGIDVKDVTVRLGDSDLPPVTIAGGSNNAASTTLVAVKACAALQRQVAEAAVLAGDSPFHGADPASLTLADGKLAAADGRSEPLRTAVGRTGGLLEVYAENVPAGLPVAAAAGLYHGRVALSHGAGGRKDVTALSFGAHFVEVRVHVMTREVRVPRVVSAFAAGTIINPMTAHSQYMGGVIWGLSSALHESTEIDPVSARIINNNLADYMVPVNADVPSIEIIMVPEKDERVNPLGVKGIGEVCVVGVNAAVANAVFNATGKRVRDLPIRAEALL